MKYVDLHGTRVPALGFGTWQLRGHECVDATKHALDLGYRHIDTAQIYENEAEVGQAIAESGLTRADLFVTTKLWTTNFTADRVVYSMRESLERLRMDYVDLLLIHWHNPAVPLAETLGAMQELLNEGKTRAIGVSNFPVALMREARALAPVSCNQVEYHALLSQAPVLDYTQSHGMMLTAYSPLARGKLLANDTLVRIAEKHGKNPGQIALRWLIQQDGVAAIPKAASAENAKNNFAIFDFALDAADMAAIFAINGNHRLINPSWAPQWDAA